MILVAPPGAERSLESLGPRAEAIVGGVSRALGITPRAPFRMVLIPAAGVHDSDLVQLDRGAPPWAAGFMNPQLRIGAIRLAQASHYPYGTPEAVLAHESAHQLMHDVPGIELPLWFEEGAATWAAREWQFEDVFQLSSRLLTHDLPRLDALEPRFHGSPDQVDQAYAVAFAFVSWSTTRYGESLVRDVLTEARTHSFERAWRLATGMPLDRSEAEWRRESVFRYRWLPLIMASSTFWLIVLVLSAWVWTRRRRRARALEAAWAEEDEWPVEDEATPPESESGLQAPDLEAAAPGERGSIVEAPQAPAETPPPAWPPMPPSPPPPGPIVWRRVDVEDDAPDGGDEPRAS